MTSIYLHRLTVTVITAECSPDVIERLIDRASDDCGTRMRIDARTDPDNRRRCPAIKIADAPVYPADGTKESELAWASAHDVWLDSWPAVADFKE